MTCKDCQHFDICSLWSTTSLIDDEPHKYCYGRYKPARGEWEFHRLKEFICCSNCGFYFDKEDYYANPQCYVYCGHCGVKMEGKIHEQEKEEEKGSDLH